VIVNPETVTSQVEEATVMALAGALLEASFTDGVITNGAFSAYRVPRMADVPRIEVILLDRPDLPSAGAGETPMIAVAPAIASAIFDATGRRLRSLPLADGGPARVLSHGWCYVGARPGHSRADDRRHQAGHHLASRDHRCS
jgi:isoquinoline 1-oxidoreductase